MCSRFSVRGAPAQLWAMVIQSCNMQNEQKFDAATTQEVVSELKTNLVSAPVFHGAAEWRKTLRRKNELLGEVLNELISRDSLDDPEALAWMCEYVVEARVALATLMEDLKSITNDAAGIS